MKFYFNENCSKSVKLPGGKWLAFDIVDHFAGSWRGVVATEDSTTIEGLDALTMRARSGVRQITKEQFDAYLKKKQPVRISRGLPESQRQPVLKASINVPAGHLVEKAADKPAEPIANVPKIYESIDEVLKTGVVKPMAQTVKVKTKPKPQQEAAA